MLNTAISLGRAGMNVQFISEIALDQPGELIVNFLHDNNVCTTFLNRYTNGKTTLTLAFLNEKADASYSFYSDPPKDRFPGKLPTPQSGDIILFGSFFSLYGDIHEKLKPFLSSARENNVQIIYDPNFRKPHLPDLPNVLPLIRENISKAHIIRGSNEDFLHIFALENPSEVYDQIRINGEKVLIYTHSKETVQIRTGNQVIFIPVPKIVPLSTIGAGDSFNAGLIYAFIKTGVVQHNISLLSVNDWEKITETAIRFSQNVCMSLENYISNDFAFSLKKW